MATEDRRRAARVNRYYHALTKEYKNGWYGMIPEKDMFIRDFYQIILELSYSPLEPRDFWEERAKKPLFPMEYYRKGSEKSENGRKKDEVIDLICGDNGERVRIEEDFETREIIVEQYLPLMTGFLLQDAQEELSQSNVYFCARLRFLAYWVFQLHEKLTDEKKRFAILVQLWDAVQKERKTDPSAAVDENGTSIIDECYQKLYMIFPFFTDSHSEKLERERRILGTRVTWEMSNFLQKMHTERGEEYGGKK